MTALYYLLGAVLLLATLAVAFVAVAFVVVLMAGTETEDQFEHSRGEEYEND